MRNSSRNNVSLILHSSIFHLGRKKFGYSHCKLINHKWKEINLCKIDVQHIIQLPFVCMCVCTIDMKDKQNSKQTGVIYGNSLRFEKKNNDYNNFLSSFCSVWVIERGVTLSANLIQQKFESVNDEVWYNFFFFLTIWHVFFLLLKCF